MYFKHSILLIFKYYDYFFRNSVYNENNKMEDY